MSRFYVPPTQNKAISENRFKGKSYWRPGTVAPGSDIMKGEKGVDDQYFVYNPVSFLAINQQRTLLPIYKKKLDFLYAVETHSLTIVVGETGSGKTTQIPQYLDEAGWTEGNRMIGITQPRRIAATSIANRVALEMNVKLGVEVGYAVRFDNCYDPVKTRIKFMTEGILLQEILGDPLLSAYSVIVLDEVHERSVNTDLLFGLFKKIMRKRKDLRLVISSATIDAVELKGFFDRSLVQSVQDPKSGLNSEAAIFMIEGKSFPVDIFYSESPVKNFLDAVIETVLLIHEKEKKGDILVFLTGEEEIEKVVTILRDEFHHDEKNSLVALPLYSSLNPKMQLKCFQKCSPGHRKVVVSTNIAETSVTIPGIVFVVDCMFKKTRFVSPLSSGESLVVVPISKSSAEQRAGRAGRVQPGKCFRLCTEADYRELPEKDIPEIQRTDLTTQILYLKALGIHNLNRFEFLTSPPVESLVASLELLHALKAIDDSGNLTDEGSKMSEIALNPRLTKILIESCKIGCSEEVLSIVAMLSVQNIFLHSQKRDFASNSKAERAKKKFAVREGDHITLLNVFTSFQHQQKNPQWCYELCLSFKALQKAVKIRSHLRKLLKKIDLSISTCCADEEKILKCILSGYFTNVAKLQNDGSYTSVQGTNKLRIHPRSVLHEQAPEWVMFHDLVTLNERFMTCVSVVETKWLFCLENGYFNNNTNLKKNDF